MTRAGLGAVCAVVAVTSALVVGPATVAPSVLAGVPIVDSATAAVGANNSIASSYLGKISLLKKPLKSRSSSSTFTTADFKDVDVASSFLAHVFVGGQNKANGPVQGMHYVSTVANRSHATDQHVSTVLDTAGGVGGPSAAVGSLVRTVAIPQGVSDRNGVYRAAVWHRAGPYNQWQQKAGGSSMFPQDWSVGDVLDTLKVAIESGQYVKRLHGVSHYTATIRNPRTGGSMTVEYTENDAGRLVSFYPVYGR